MKPPKTPKKKVTLGTRERHQDEQQLDGLLVVSSRRHKPSKKMTAKKKFLHREKTPSNHIKNIQKNQSPENKINNTVRFYYTKLFEDKSETKSITLTLEFRESRRIPVQMIK
jgi:hypothetical protein